VSSLLFHEVRSFAAQQTFPNFQFRLKFSSSLNGCLSPVPPASSFHVSSYLSSVSPSISVTSTTVGGKEAVVPQTTETGCGDDGDRTSAGGVGGVSDNNNSMTKASIRGEVLDLAADLRTFRPGDRLDIPYELTISESMQEFWQSAFHSQDRINTSR
jgi:hypothetical protein